MTTPHPNKPGRPKKPRVRSRDIRGSKYLRTIGKLLRRLRSHRDCPNRQLHYDDYVAYIVLYFFSPVLTSMRAIQQASTLKKVHGKLGLKRFSLGSFSEAGRVFDPALLQPIIAELVADLFRYRWQIELFFRWFKTVLRADHLLSLSRNGLTIAAYCALIASLLITLWTGRKPTKRTYEMLCLYFAGWADEEELEAHIEKLAPAVQ